MLHRVASVFQLGLQLLDDVELTQRQAAKLFGGHVPVVQILLELPSAFDGASQGVHILHISIISTKRGIVQVFRLNCLDGYTIVLPYEAPLTHGKIARFYVPLAVSWLFMAIESPVCIAAISRLAFPELNTAAFNIMMGLALFIESPVIDLLSTSTTLAKSHLDYLKLRKFVWIVMLGVTTVHGLATMTPLYSWISQGVMGLPEHVAAQARPGLIIMLGWSACIGWRRFLQGILIRFHRTRLISLGTAIRVGTVTVACLSLIRWSSLSGVQVTAIALMASVAAEAAFIHWVSRPVIAQCLAAAKPEIPVTESDEDTALAAVQAGAVKESMPFSAETGLEPADEKPSQPLTNRRLLAFHAPLTMTTLVTLIGLPTISAFLSKTPTPVLTLAAWQVAGSLMWLFRTITFALPEVVITLYKDEQTARKLRDFCVLVGAGCTVAVLVIGGLRLDVWFFENVYGHTSQISEIAHLAFLASAPLAVIGSAQSYVRGMLTAHHLNVARFAAILVSMSTLVLGLTVGLHTPWSGVLSASAAMIVALLAEQSVLVWAWRHKVGGRLGWAAKRAVVP